MTWRQSLLRLLSLVLIGLSVLSCQASVASKQPDIGMTVHSRGADAETIKRQFDLMAAMHVTWVRVDVGWAWVESERGQFDWAYPDEIVSEAAARGMKVLVVLANSPAWAGSSAPGQSAIEPYSRPANLSDFASFARIAAQRYASRGVRSWEIWNEPNTSQFWPPSPDANEYGDLFRVIAAAIRRVDPKATLLIGGLSPKTDSSGAEIPPAKYLEQLYGNGAAQLADGIAAHPYSYPALPMQKSRQAAGGFKDLPALHAVMVRHGDGQKKIWITEFGAPTGTDPAAVSEEAQAAAFSQARQLVASWAWAGPLIYYELVDGGTDPSDKEQNFGVLHEDLTAKAAALALMRPAPA